MIIQLSNINYRHSGDTFRELVHLWEDKGLCKITSSNKKHSCWIGNIMLYDEPLLEWYTRYRYEYDFALFGNTVPELPNSSSWIFWARRPSLLQKCRSVIPDYSSRSINSVFLGKIENNIQHHKRTQEDWSKVIDMFEMPVQGVYKYSQSEYLENIKNSKYGLCLSGYGPKCNREIELMGVGTVPIITPLVDVTYYNPLIENKHYIKVDTPQQVNDKINNISQEEWEYMSNNCLKWYEKNASINGSFNTTIEILEKNNAI